MLLTRERISLAEAAALVESPKRGAVVSFSGNVRDTEDGKPLRAIAYEAYEEMALKSLRRLVEEAERRWDVSAAVFHRLGEVPAGESSLVIVCAGTHRPEAFEACRHILEEIKADVPIWKAGFEGKKCC